MPKRLITLLRPLCPEPVAGGREDAVAVDNGRIVATNDEELIASRRRRVLAAWS